MFNAPFCSDTVFYSCITSETTSSLTLITSDEQDSNAGSKGDNVNHLPVIIVIGGVTLVVIVIFVAYRCLRNTSTNPAMIHAPNGLFSTNSNKPVSYTHLTLPTNREV